VDTRWKWLSLPSPHPIQFNDHPTTGYGALLHCLFSPLAGVSMSVPLLSLEEDLKKFQKGETFKLIYLDNATNMVKHRLGVKLGVEHMLHTEALGSNPSTEILYMYTYINTHIHTHIYIIYTYNYKAYTYSLQN
jgi:hypothetical protein